MSKFTRLAALAMFCAAFGFGGSVGGMVLMQDDQTDAPGPAGPTGSPGPPGQAGPAGPAAETSGLEFDLTQLVSRVDDLESAETSGQGCAMMTRLVTDVSTLGLDPTVRVSKTPFFVCVNPGP